MFLRLDRLNKPVARRTFLLEGQLQLQNTLENSQYLRFRKTPIIHLAIHHISRKYKIC